MSAHPCSLQWELSVYTTEPASGSLFLEVLNSEKWTFGIVDKFALQNDNYHIHGIIYKLSDVTVFYKWTQEN